MASVLQNGDHRLRLFFEISFPRFLFVLFCGYMDQVGECWIVLLGLAIMTTTSYYMKRSPPSLNFIYGL